MSAHAASRDGMETARLRGDDELYRRFLRRDHADDGKFLTGVLTTGIYCLPSCPAKRPKRENVRFFHSPEEARRSGLRPCFRCRPDALYRGEEFHESLFEQTVARARKSPADFRGVDDLVRASGLSRTALSDLFREHSQESPGAFLRRTRAEFARLLLENGAKPAEAAACSGYGSASAFHQQFSLRTGLTPAVYTGLGRENRFTLRLPDGYRKRDALAFFGRDAEGVAERVRADGFTKCFVSDGQAVAVEVTFAGGTAVCTTDPGSAHMAHRAVSRMLGLESDAPAFERQFADDALLGGLVRRQRGLRIPLTPEPWEALGWAIIGQQISLGAAVALRRSLIRTLGWLHAKSGLRAFPPASTVARADVDLLLSLKFSRSKAEYLLAAARAVTAGQLPVSGMRELSARRIARLLSAVRGVGPWTVQYVFLRGVGYADCLPAGDAGLARGLERLTGRRPDENAVKAAMARFAPFRSLAAGHIWASLDNEGGEFR